MLVADRGHPGQILEVVAGAELRQQSSGAYGGHLLGGVVHDWRLVDGAVRVPGNDPARHEGGRAGVVVPGQPDVAVGHVGEVAGRNGVGEELRLLPDHVVCVHGAYPGEDVVVQLLHCRIEGGAAVRVGTRRRLSSG